MNRRTRVGRFLAATVVLLLGGCLSIPIPTLWKLRRLDVTAIRDLDPEVLQGVVLNQNGPRFNATGLRIHVRFDVTRPVTDCFRTELRLRTLDEPPPGDLPKAPRAAPGDHWTVLALDELSVRRVVKVQEALRALPADGKAKWDFDVDFGKSAPPAPTRRPYHSNVWMRLQAQQGYLLLFDRLAVDPSSRDTGADRQKSKIATTGCRDIT